MGCHSHGCRQSACATAAARLGVGLLACTRTALRRTWRGAVLFCMQVAGTHRLRNRTRARARARTRSPKAREIRVRARARARVRREHFWRRTTCDAGLPLSRQLLTLLTTCAADSADSCAASPPRRACLPRRARGDAASSPHRRESRAARDRAPSSGPPARP